MPKLTDYLRVPSVVISLFKTSYRSSGLACLKYSTGSFCYFPALHGIRVGSVITYLSSFTFIKNYNSHLLSVGSIVQLNKLPRFSVVSNISLKGDSSPKYAKSSGTYAFLDEILHELGLCIVKLPSGLRRVVSLNTLVLLGRNSNRSQKHSVIGKAGFLINKGKKQITRGVAMNPVDHPNGGRTKTNKPEKSPWGWVAKRGS